MIKFTNLYVETLARGLMSGNEQLVARGAGFFQSFWSFRIPFFRHAYLLLATTDRLILVDHRKGLIFDRMDKIESDALGRDRLAESYRLPKKLVVKDASNRTVLKMRLPPVLANPIADNRAQLRIVEQTWQQQERHSRSHVRRTSNPGPCRPSSRAAASSPVPATRSVTWRKAELMLPRRIRKPVQRSG